ncbi:restriction endonuclease subunit S [uncultured Brachyspira sp.]|uniref:restriction endonuclease subunit S n=1 Tax=uncultured Brachyspira sp. TaxID=221953 RepID=UPI002620C64F|nr:restriction endonuclease subunit S [uncultured Brachyspira sp.]
MKDVKLPSGWREFQLKDIGYFLRGSGISKKDLSDTGVPAVRYGDIYTKYDFIIKNISSYTNSKGTELKRGDILFAGSGETAEEIGKSAAFLDDYKVLAGGDIIIFRPNIDLNSLFLCYILNFGRCRKEISIMGQGHTVVHVYASSLEKLMVTLPPIDEQKRIADILSLCDDIIENLAKLIEKKELYKKGVMQRVLTGKVRFNGFTDEWKDIFLYEVLKERKIYQSKDGSLEHVSLTKDGIIPKTERYERDFLVKDKNKQYKITKINDICYNPANLKFGVICKNNYGEGIFSPIYVTFEVNKEFDADFFTYIFKSKSFIHNVRRYEKGTVYERKSVSPENFLSIKIKVPNLEEQKRISELISTIDAEIDNLKKQLELRKLQKKGIMQRLLTGEVRV